EIGQPYHSADVTIGEVFGLGKIGNGRGLAALQPAPPVPGASDGAQHMRILHPSVGRRVTCWRQDLRTTVLPAKGERDDHADGVFGHAASFSICGASICCASDLMPSWRRSMARPVALTVTRATRSWTMRACSA